MWKAPFGGCGTCKTEEQGILEFDSSMQNVQQYPLENYGGSETIVSTLFSSKNMVFFITGSVDSPQFSVSLWRNSTIENIQMIENPIHGTADDAFEHNYMVSTTFLQ